MEIHSRIAIGKKIFLDKNIGNLKLEVNKSVIKCLVCGVALYDAETWTFNTGI